jgi:pimeloyl-ACP methyl ester carboxylesterase
VADVILLHGLWHRGWSVWRLAARLRRMGHKVHTFSYPTLGHDPEQNVRALEDFCRQRADAGFCMVGHSLGGLVILSMLAAEQAPKPARVVMLGTPLNGSLVARRLVRTAAGRRMLGRSAGILTEGVAAVPAGIACGMISGTQARGLGRLTGPLDGPNDGTVCVSETSSERLADQVELEVTHTGMLLSAEVARQASCFLQNGVFQHSV